jgi:tRNA1Val (adenine37-N6)-methyltransferase
MGRFTAVAQAAGLHHTATLEIRHRPGGRVTRHISSFGHQHRPVTQSSLCILDAAGLGYSAEFQALLAGFYLAF